MVFGLLGVSFHARSAADTARGVDHRVQRGGLEQAAFSGFDERFLAAAFEPSAPAAMNAITISTGTTYTSQRSSDMRHRVQQTP
ncbi:MAG: hypothetical protein U1F11_14810 [Steroidobacteraceae bacterium]